MAYRVTLTFIVENIQEVSDDIVGIGQIVERITPDQVPYTQVLEEMDTHALMRIQVAVEPVSNLKPVVTAKAVGFGTFAAFDSKKGD
jgi:hypothetical protein